MAKGVAHVEQITMADAVTAGLVMYWVLMYLGELQKRFSSCYVLGNSGEQKANYWM